MNESIICLTCVKMGCEQKVFRSKICVCVYVIQNGQEKMAVIGNGQTKNKMAVIEKSCNWNGYMICMSYNVPLFALTYYIVLIQMESFELRAWKSC